MIISQKLKNSILVIDWIISILFLVLFLINPFEGNNQFGLLDSLILLITFVGITLIKRIKIYLDIVFVSYILYLIFRYFEIV